MNLSIVAAGENGIMFPGEIREMYWAIAAFLVIVGLVVWKGLPGIRQGLTGRTERIQGELDAAQADREQAELELVASTSTIADPEQREREMRAEAVQTANKLKVDMLAKAEAEADAIRERGRADVANMKRQAQADLSAEVSRMTRDSAEAVVMSGLNDQSHGELIDNYINQVSQMS